MTIPLDAVETLDAVTTTHSARVTTDLTYAAGDFLLALLYTRHTDTDQPTVTAGDPEYSLHLASIISPFTNPYRFVFGYTRPTAGGDFTDELNWEWSTGTGVEASAVVVAAHRAHMVSGGSGFADNVNAATVSTTGGYPNGLVMVLWVISEGGTTVTDADLIARTDGASMPSGHGYVEAWAFQGAGPHTVDITATSGNVTFWYWVELIEGGSQWTIGRIAWGTREAWH